MSKEIEKILEEFDKEFKSEDGRDFFNEAERISRARIFLKISLKQALTQQKEELKKKIEGKRKEEHDENCLTNAPNGYFPEKSDYCDCRNPQFNQGIDAALSELNHQ